MRTSLAQNISRGRARLAYPIPQGTGRWFSVTWRELRALEQRSELNDTDIPALGTAARVVVLFVDHARRCHAGRTDERDTEGRVEGDDQRWQKPNLERSLARRYLSWFMGRSWSNQIRWVERSRIVQARN